MSRPRGGFVLIALHLHRVPHLWCSKKTIPRVFGGNGYATSPLMGQYLPPTRAALSTSYHPCTTGTHAGSNAESQFPMPLGYNRLNSMTKLHSAIDTLVER